MTAERLRFDRYVLETDSGELRRWRGGEAVALQPQPGRVLEALLRAPGRVVSREELAVLLWGDRHFVDRDLGLNQCVMQIRRALGDDAQQPRFVQTVPRRGYRFLLAVEVEENRPTLVPEGRPCGWTRRAWAWLARPFRPRIEVTAPARLVQHETPPAAIGREVGTGLLLKARFVEERRGLRATAQLIESQSEVLLWSYEAALDPADPGAWARGLVPQLALHLGLDATTDGRKAKLRPEPL
jgi:DNA-binding winged helix-turn-helix (wHTH) protein